MKRKLTGLSRRYAAALRKHLRQSPRASLEPAREWGRQAAAAGLETSDAARIHQTALGTLEPVTSREDQRAESFFTEVVTVIENSHPAAFKTNTLLSQLNKKLGRRTVDLAASNRSLKQGIARRKLVEEALKESGRHSRKLLKESLALQKHLQHLAHRILAAQEDKRKKISHELHDEVAQTLLAINVRLLTLRTAARGGRANLKKEIASTQRLVEQSVQSINRFARELNTRQSA